VRGNDRRSRLAVLLQRLGGERGMVHVFGDSQSAVYEAMPNVIVHRVNGVTMFRVGRDRAALTRRLRWRMGGRSALMFVFGGIDARRHVGPVAEATGRPVEAVIEELVDAYLRAIDLRRGGRRVLVVGMLPPAANEAIGPQLGVWGTQEQRIAIARRLDERLAARCADFGFGFVSHYDKYADAEGRQRPGMTFDGVHLHEEMRGPAIAGVRAALVALTGGEYR
jgi:hypothetical protein